MQHNKRNWQFARSMRAGRRAAVVMSLLHLARLNSHDVRASMKDVRKHLPTLPASHISDVVPHRWTHAYFLQLSPEYLQDGITG